MTFGHLKRVLATIGVACAFCAQSRAAAPAVEFPWVNEAYHVDIDVDAGGRVTETVGSQFRALQQRAVDEYKRFSFSYSTSIQSGEVLEAYTLKKDGRRLPVPQDNYQTTTNAGRGTGAPVYSDYKTLAVVFPDFEVGDSVHVRYRIADKEAMFPGQFSIARSVSPFTPYQDVKYTVRVAPGIAFKTEAHTLSERTATEADGTRVVEWKYSNPRPRPYDEDKDGGLWQFTDSPSFLASSFPSYEAIGAAYAARALPKAQVTPQLSELAARIVGNESAPREKARRIYEWVSRTITYGGNCIGVGAVVPRDVDVVLANKMGDCKDHATLLQALLAAAGVRSEQVLINAGRQYELAATPVVAMVNHVMNYLPDLDLYVDATAKDIPFGYLPTAAHGKPVIHVGRAASAVQVIAPASHELNEQRVKMAVNIDPSGGAKGTLHVALKGLAAASYRGYMGELDVRQEQDFVKRVLQEQGIRGGGVLARGDARELADTYEFSISFDAKDLLKPGAVATFPAWPLVQTPMPVGMLADVDPRKVEVRPNPCQGFISTETLEFVLPANLAFVDMPRDLQVRKPMIDYKVQTVKAGRKLTISREVVDRTRTGICSAAEQNEFTKQATPVSENLRHRMLVRLRKT